MKWASSLSEKRAATQAAKECLDGVLSQMDGVKPDLALLFVSKEHADEFDDILNIIHKKIAPAQIAGCSGGGIIGAGHEVEGQPAVSLTAAALPGVTIRPFALEDDGLPDMDASPRAWEEAVGVSHKDNPAFIVFADPFTIRVENFLAGLDYAFPQSRKVGGLASGAQEAGQNALFINGQRRKAGLAGVSLAGNVNLETLVAQGCKPIGPALRITDCQQNVLISLENISPLEQLQKVVDSLPDRERRLVPHSLFLGVITDSSKSTLEKGDFLIRNIIGADQSHGYLAVGAALRKGQLVQFHLRDAQTSSDDLRTILSRKRQTKNVQGALLFSCMGRGQYLYGHPDHDSQLFQQNIGPVPLGGFFCNGEIGPVGASTYLHGYTSCFGLFSPKE